MLQGNHVLCAQWTSYGEDTWFRARTVRTRWMFIPEHLLTCSTYFVKPDEFFFSKKVFTFKRDLLFTQFTYICLTSWESSSYRWDRYTLQNIMFDMAAAVHVTCRTAIFTEHSLEQRLVWQQSPVSARGSIWSWVVYISIYVTVKEGREHVIYILCLHLVILLCKSNKINIHHTNLKILN